MYPSSGGINQKRKKKKKEFFFFPVKKKMFIDHSICINDIKNTKKEFNCLKRIWNVIYEEYTLEISENIVLLRIKKK